jgi:N-acetylglucosamine-6-phosphate deacetylase
MNKAVENVVNKVGVDFIKAVDFATINPAKNLGVDKEVGSIKVGKKADFVVIDKDFNVLLTIRDGNIIYKA